MILQQLHADADAIFAQTERKTIIPSMYDLMQLRWVVEIDSTGRMSPKFSPLVTTDSRGKEHGIKRPLPYYKRSGTDAPALLLADKPAYSLGLVFPRDLKGKDEVEERAKAKKTFAKFKALLRTCANATGNTDVEAIIRFLDTWNPDSLPPDFPTDMRTMDWVTFRVDGKQFPLDDLAVQSFWAGEGQLAPALKPERKPKPTATNASEMQCLITGLRGPVVKRMPLFINGIPGGLPGGKELISGNLKSAESYGLTEATTSPICRDAAEQFAKALNALLASDKHHRLLQNTVYAYWSAAGIPPLLAIDPGPDIDQVHDFMDAVGRGVPWCNLPKDARFHIFGLSANIKRAVVRSVLDISIRELGEAQFAWFTRLKVIGPNGQEWRPPTIKQLILAPYRDYKGITPGTEDALVQCALSPNAHLPKSLLAAVVSRCHVGTKKLNEENTTHVTYDRAALLKYIITQDRPLEVAEYMSEEKPGALPNGINGTPYHCGRLFAELEDIQRQALPGLNAGIGDKYFGAASMSPARTFGILLVGVKHHLSSLRKTQEGAWYGAQQRLEEILAQIEDFPQMLLLPDQALFSLGYYHHCAAKRKNITARTEAKKRASQLTLEPDETKPTDPQATEGDTE